MPHIHDDIDFAVSIIILHPDKDKILFGYQPRYSFWLVPGGHIELNETPDEAVIREAKEETGLDVKIVGQEPAFRSDTDSEVSLARPRFVSFHEAQAPHRHVGLVYVCSTESDVIIKSGEHEILEWKTRSEIEKLERVPEYSRRCALTVLDEVQRS